MSEVVRRLTEDVANIQKLGDNPRTDNGMDAAELKAWFDKAPEAIKSFLNESMIPDIERKFRSQDEWADTVDEAINSFVKGEGFVPLDGSQPMTGDLNMDGHRVVGVADPTDGSHATNKKYVDSVKETANTALAKANAAQPALNFVPVQQGFADGTGGSKIRLGWKQASNGYWTIGVEVANLYIGDVVVDSSEFGSTTPVWRGGTGAQDATTARANLGVARSVAIDVTDCNTAVEFGHYRVMSNTLNAPVSPNNGHVLFVVPWDKNTGQQLYFDVYHANMFIRNFGSGGVFGAWREVYTASNPMILNENHYGTAFPSNAVTGQLFFLKG